MSNSGIMNNQGAVTCDSITGRWDKLGSMASTLCALHCLVSPLFFLAMPAFAKVWAHPASHALMALFVVPLALTVVIFGYREHRERWVLVTALTGITFILTGSTLPYLPKDMNPFPVVAAAESLEADGACADCCPAVVTDEEGESRLHMPPAGIATITGSFLLIGAHLGNRRGCARCRKRREEEDESN